jgi:Protein of unknown function (DUF2877)
MWCIVGPEAANVSAGAVSIGAIIIGARAAHLLATRSTWTVAATFERSFYLRSGDAFVCIGARSIGRGPLNGLTSATAGDGRPFIKVGPHGKTPIVDLSHATIWRAPPWPTPPMRPARTDVRHVLRAARAAAPPSSFIHAICPDLALHDLVLARAGRGLGILQSAIIGGDQSQIETAVDVLLGLGLGLTPSGDDALCGALIMMHALGAVQTASSLASAVRARMRQGTSMLSCAFLDAACDGEASEALHQSIAALLVGGAPDDVIRPTATIGHSSGFDMLAGALLVAATCHTDTNVPVFFSGINNWKEVI